MIVMFKGLNSEFKDWLNAMNWYLGDVRVSTYVKYGTFKIG